MKTKYIVFALLLIVLIVMIYTCRHTLSPIISWPELVVIFEFIALLFLWKKTGVKKLVGEDNHRQSSAPRRYQLIKYGINFFFFLILFIALSIYFLVGESNKSLPSVTQFSIIGIAPVLGGLVLTAASSFDREKRSQLIHVSQKFIASTALFIIFVPSIFMVDSLHGININSITTSSLLNPGAWWRAIYFWLLAVPSFYGGIVLFVWGLRDFIVVLSRISTAGELEQGNPQAVLESQHPPREPETHVVLEGQRQPRDPETHKDKRSHTSTILILLISLVLLILSLLSFLLFPIIWPHQKDVLMHIGVETAGLAISFPLIYLLVERTINTERRNKWKRVRSAVLDMIKTLSTNMLFHFDFKLSPNSLAQFAVNSNTIIDEARRVSNQAININWSNNTTQLEYFASALETNTKAIISFVGQYSSVLDEEADLFEKIIDMQKKMNSVIARSSNYGSGQTPFPNNEINQSLRELLLATITIIEVIDQQKGPS